MMKNDSDWIIENQEEKRVEALKKYHVLDTIPEQEYDAIVKLTSYICDISIVLINFLDNERQWCKARIGIDFEETPKDESFCKYTIKGDEILEVPDTLNSPLFQNHPLVVGEPYIRYYAGIPLKTPDGFPIGTICLIDAKPRKLKDEQKSALQTMADQVIYNLELRKSKNDQEKRNKENRELKRKLVKSKDEVFNILESITDGFYAVDRYWLVTYFNMEAERLLQVKKEEIIGQNLWDKFYEAIPLKFYTEYSRALRDNVKVNFEEYYPPLKSWYDVHAYPSGNGLSVYFKDITSHKRISERERAGKEVLELNAISGNTLPEIIKFYLSEIEKLHEGIHLSVLQVKGSKLYNLAAPGLPDAYCHAIQGIQIQKDNGSCGAAAYAKQRIIVSDIETDPKWKAYKHIALKHNLLSCWSFPITNTRGEVIATCAAYYNEKKSPSTEEIETLENVAKLLSIILENKSSEIALKESIEWFNHVSKATNDCLWDWNLITNEVFRSESLFYKLFGYKEKDQKKTYAFWKDNVHPEDLPKVTPKLLQIINGSSKKFWEEYYRFRRLDGTYAYVHDRGYIIYNKQGKPVRMIGAMQDISHRKEAEDELKKLSLIAKETVNAVILTDTSGRITWVNDGFTKITEYSLNEVTGKKPGSFLQGEDSDKAVIAYMSEQIKLKKNFSCEIVNYSKSGNRYWVKIQGQPLFDSEGKVEGFFAIETDITRQKEEEQQLKLLESVITNSYDAVLIFHEKSKSSPSFKIVYANNSFSKLTGYKISEILGKTPGILSGPLTDEKSLDKIHVALDKKESCELEIVNYGKEGNHFWINLSLIPIINKAGICTHWISIQRDISLRINHEKERESLIEELQQNNADLKQFSFITSHNLRAPVSNLIGITNLIDMDSIIDPENKMLLEKVKDSTNQLNSTINDLLNILVIKNSTDIFKANLAISSIFNDVVSSVETLLVEVGGSYTVDFSQGDVIHFNKGYLHSILLNLLTNSIKYRSPERSLKVHLETKYLKNVLELKYSDNGLGIDLERYHDRLFGLYQRFHEHHDSKGMGLYITNTQMKAMGGTIQVNSKVNVGTNFILNFKANNGS